MRNTERSGNELYHGDWEIMIMNMIPFFILLTTLNPKGQTKAQGTNWRGSE